MATNQTSPFLFSVRLELPSGLTGDFPEELREVFKNHHIHLSQAATIQPLEPNKRWRVTDGGQQYLVEKVGQSLNVYTSPLPELYGRWTVDCVIEVAQWVSLDFVSRPRHYRLVPDGIAQILQDFKALTGKDPNWPDLAQRTAIYGAFVGDSDGKRDTDRTAQFHRASVALRTAAIAFAQRVYDTGKDMLLQAFRDAEVTLRTYLNTLDGRVVTLGYTQTRAIFGKAVNVLGTQEVARVFGLPPAPGGDWPLKGTYDGDGAYLIEEITRVLQPATIGLVSEQQFIVMQRIAHYGAETITGVLDDSLGWDGEDRTKKRIQSAYSWWTALRDISLS